MLDRLFGSSLDPGKPFFRQNLLANVCDGAIFALALSLVSQQTVLPVFVKKIGGGNIAIGLIPVLWTVGFNLPQILIANFVQRVALKKRFMMITSLIQRTPWLLLAIFSAFWLDQVNAGTGLILFFTMFTLAAIAGSINLPVWFDLVAKITPVDVRGRLFATRNVLGAMLGVFGGWVVTRVLVSIEYPANFAGLFLLAFLAMMISYFFLSRLKEDKSSSATQPVSHREYLRSLPRILKRQRNFRNYLIADALLITATMAGAFYTVRAIEKFSLADEYAGTFIMVMMVSTMIGTLFFGYLADHFGHRLNMMLSAIFTIVACVMALLAPTVQIYLFVFVSWALASGLSGISRLSIIAEFCSDADRPTYIALTNMITSPFVLAGVMGGWIANQFGYSAVFAIAALLATASAIWLKMKVVEPRKRVTTRFMREVQIEAS